MSDIEKPDVIGAETEERTSWLRSDLLPMFFAAIGQLNTNLEEAYLASDWRSLGYPDWDSYLLAEFGAGALDIGRRVRDRVEGQQDHRDVYFLQAPDGGPVKIGVAADVDGRVATIQRMSPVEVRCIGVIREAGLRMEQELHRVFADSRLHGEWFSPTPRLLGLIARHPA